MELPDIVDLTSFRLQLEELRSEIRELTDICSAIVLEHTEEVLKLPREEKTTMNDLANTVSASARKLFLQLAMHYADTAPSEASMAKLETAAKESFTFF